MITSTVVLLVIVLSLAVASIILGAVIASKKHSPSSSHTSSHTPSQDKSCKTEGDGSRPRISNNHSTTMEKQPESSVQILNNTSKEHLHVFLQVKDMSERWSKLGGNGEIYPPVDWGAKGMAWDPVGALKLAEAIVPKDGSSLIMLFKR